VPRILVGLTLAVFAVIAAPASALAECAAWAEPAPPSLRYAFTATVTDASTDVEPTEGAPFDWHVDLAIDEVYRGELPDRIVYNGHDAGCHALRGDRLSTGERIFVVANEVNIRGDRGDPFGGIRPQVMAWHWTGDAWAFYDEALDPSQNDQTYPPEARSATTTAAILQFIWSMPDTSVEPRTVIRPGTGHPIPLLVVVFVVALTASLRLGWPRPR
jgi:hypothetical protein